MQICSKNGHKRITNKESTTFSVYLDCRNNHYEVDLLGTSTFKPIPYSSWIKNNTQQKPIKKKLYKNDLLSLIDEENLTDNKKFKSRN